MLPDKEEVRMEVWGLLRMAESHANVERETLHEHYREDEDGLLPDLKLEESCSLKYRWQQYEAQEAGSVEMKPSLIQKIVRGKKIMRFFCS